MQRCKTVGLWDREWIGQVEITSGLDTARDVAVALAKDRGQPALVYDTFTLEPLAHFDYDGTELDLAHLKEWENPEPELTEEEERERREEFRAEQEFDISREQQ